MLATEIGSFEGPFDQIKNMIQKMRFRLMAEQKDGDDHKTWCDSEPEQNNESKDNEDNCMELRNTKHNSANAEAAALTEDISKANAVAARLIEYIQEEMNLRTENSAEVRPLRLMRMRPSRQ
jgi:hypothetical protein